MDRKHPGVDRRRRPEGVTADPQPESNCHHGDQAAGAEGRRRRGWRGARATCCWSTRSARSGPPAGVVEQQRQHLAGQPERRVGHHPVGLAGSRSRCRPVSMTRIVPLVPASGAAGLTGAPSPACSVASASRAAHRGSASTAHTRAPARARGRARAPDPAPRSTTSSPGAQVEAGNETGDQAVIDEEVLIEAAAPALSARTRATITMVMALDRRGVTLPPPTFSPRPPPAAASVDRRGRRYLARDGTRPEIVLDKA